MAGILPSERIISRIFLMREKKVMLDSDLAELYGVETRTLNQAVRRNMARFPEDFAFRLTWEESRALRSQIVTLNGDDSDEFLKSQTVTSKRGAHTKYQPYVFTEQGVAMLSSVLKSKRAVAVNIQIIRTFVKLREMLSHYKDLKEKIEAMEQEYDERFRIVFEALRRFIEEEEKPKRSIGFGVE